MADVSKISLFGTSYSIKDSTARSSASNASTTATAAKNAADKAQTTADAASTKANTNATSIATLAGETLSVAYDTSTETVGFTKGVTVQSLTEGFEIDLSEAQ